MDFRIADTFLDSLARLTDQEQKTVKTTVFDLQVNPANPDLQFHKLDRARDPHFWSVRVTQDVRLIVHKTHASLLVCYVNHHDHAYRRAEQRKLETHPATGAAQLVHIREEVKTITMPVRASDRRAPAALRRAAGMAARRAPGRRGRAAGHLPNICPPKRSRRC